MTVQGKPATPSNTSEEVLEIALTLQRANFELKVDVSLPAQGISVLFGPSGSGKTSLLRCVAGLEPHGVGRVVLGGSVMQDTAQGIHWPSHQRPLGYVFQEASLFEHLDVMGNLRFGLNPKRLHNKMLHRVKRLKSWGCRPCWAVKPNNSRVVSANEWPSGAHWRLNPGCFYWTNPLHRWTMGEGARFCLGWKNFATSCTCPCSTSPTRKRR